MVQRRGLVVNEHPLYRMFNDGKKGSSRFFRFDSSQKYGFFVNSLICEDRVPVMVGHDYSGRSLNWLSPMDEAQRLSVDAYRCFARDLLTDKCVDQFRGQVVIESPEILKGEDNVLIMSLGDEVISHNAVISNHSGKYTFWIENVETLLRSALEKYHLFR